MSDTFTVTVANEAIDSITKTLNRLERMHQRRGLLFAASWGEERLVQRRVHTTGRQRPVPGSIQHLAGPNGVVRMGTYRYTPLTVTMSPLSDEWDLLYTVSPANPAEAHGSEAIIKVNPLITKNAGLMHIVETTMPSTFWDQCDHCESGRRGRSQTMVMRHKETDELAIVGSSCVQEYTGVDPALVERIIGFKAQATSGNGGGARGTPTMMSTLEFAIRGSMWIHANDAYRPGLGSDLMGLGLVQDDKGTIGFGYRATQPARWVINRPAGGITEPVDFRWLNFPEGDEVVVPESISPSVVAVAEDFMDYCANLSGSSSFEHTVRNIFKSGVVTAKTANMAGGALSGYLKHLGREVKRKAAEERKAAAPAGKHLGTVGQRMDFGEARVVFIRRIDGYYGTTTLTKLMAGNDTLVWFRSGDKSDLLVGDTVTITGTVKKHDAFKDEKQTVITRAKFTKEVSA